LSSFLFKHSLTLSETNVLAVRNWKALYCDERIASLVWAFLWKLTRIIPIELATLKLS
jgi:hypothetical protein